ncbi:hypothetical protein AKJ16_DCAP18993 [Drosera capensis]
MSWRFNLSNPTDVYDPLVEEAWTVHELTSMAKSLEIPFIYAAIPTASVVMLHQCHILHHSSMSQCDNRDRSPRSLLPQAERMEHMGMLSHLWFYFTLFVAYIAIISPISSHGLAHVSLKGGKSCSSSYVLVAVCEIIGMISSAWSVIAQVCMLDMIPDDKRYSRLFLASAVATCIACFCLSMLQMKFSKWFFNYFGLPISLTGRCAFKVGACNLNRGQNLLFRFQQIVTVGNATESGSLLQEYLGHM